MDAPFDLRSHLEPRAHARRPGCGLVAAAAVAALVLALAYWAAGRLCAGARVRRLLGAGWVLYLRPACGACAQQMALLGGSYPRTVICGAGGAQLGGYTRSPPEACKNMPPAAPIWYNALTGASRLGVQGKAALDAMGGR